MLRTLESERERNKVRYQKEKDHRKEYEKKRRIKDGDKMCTQKRGYRATIEGKFVAYKGNAIRRNISFNLSLKEFITFWQKDCWYCGDSIKTISLDRVDNTVGYILSNVTSCCDDCNFMKGTLTQAEFLAHCHKVAGVANGQV